MALQTEKYSKPRSHLLVTFYFVFGFVCGHYLWLHVQQVLDPRSQRCPDAPLVPQTNPFESIRNKIAYSVFKKELFPAVSDLSSKETATGDQEEEDFLFIGIMTARKYLESRALASSMTWVPRVPGKVVYFLGEGEPYNGPLNVIQLEGVTENDYPPQKKSFAMVAYMAKHFSDKYRWLIRADDDVYMRVDKLVKFLKSVNDSQPHYIGQPGFGKPVEAGKLGLSGAFCMGGPGVIMTREIVKGVAPGLNECLKVTVTGHEDTELGRCITINTGVHCTTAYDMKELFYQNYAELDLPQSSFKKQLGKEEIKAINLHPVKDPSYVFRLDNFFNNIQYNALRHRQAVLQAKIKALDHMTGMKVKDEGLIKLRKSSEKQNDTLHSDTTMFTEAMDRGLGSSVNLENIRRLPTTKSIYQGSDKSWEFIRYKRMFSTTFETGKLEFSLEFKRRTQLHMDMQRAVKNLPEYAKAAPKFVNETYHRLTTNMGIEALLFVKKWSKNNKYVEPLYLRRPLQDKLIDFREADDLDEEMGARGKTIYMLMPLFQRSAIYKRFLEMHARVVAGYKGKVELRVVMFTDDRGEYKLMSAMTYSMLNAHPHLDIRITYLEEAFNRGRGLMTAMSDLPYQSLLLFMDVDMEYSALFLHRVSKYTVMGKSTFFPIYFVHYNPESICYKEDDCDSLLNSRRDEVGLWRSFSFGIGAVYKKDLQRAGGFRTDIVGWGLEDVDFFEKCITVGLDVIRGSDPSMIHRYHPRECNMSLPQTQLQQCLDSGAAMLGSPKKLYQMLSDVSEGKEV